MSQTCTSEVQVIRVHLDKMRLLFCNHKIGKWPSERVWHRVTFKHFEQLGQQARQTHRSKYPRHVSSQTWLAVPEKSRWADDDWMFASVVTNGKIMWLHWATVGISSHLSSCCARQISQFTDGFVSLSEPHKVIAEVWTATGVDDRIVPQIKRRWIISLAAKLKEATGRMRQKRKMVAQILWNKPGKRLANAGQKHACVNSWKFHICVSCQKQTTTPPPHTHTYACAKPERSERNSDTFILKSHTLCRQQRNTHAGANFQAKVCRELDETDNPGVKVLEQVCESQTPVKRKGSWARPKVCHVLPFEDITCPTWNKMCPNSHGNFSKCFRFRSDMNINWLVHQTVQAVSHANSRRRSGTLVSGHHAACTKVHNAHDTWQGPWKDEFIIPNKVGLLVTSASLRCFKETSLRPWFVGQIGGDRGRKHVFTKMSPVTKKS